MPIVLQHAARRGEPGAREAVVVGDARELVPRIVDRIDLGIVRPAQLAFELQIVGRIGEDQIDRSRRELRIPATQSPSMMRSATQSRPARRVPHLLPSTAPPRFALGEES